MKNVWVDLANKKSKISQINGYLEKALKDHDELPYAIYKIVDVVYESCQHSVTWGLDKDDAIQECVLAILDYLASDNDEHSLFDTFTSLCIVVSRKINDLSLSSVNGLTDTEKLAESFYNKLKAAKKLS